MKGLGPIDPVFGVRIWLVKVDFQLIILGG